MNPLKIPCDCFELVLREILTPNCLHIPTKLICQNSQYSEGQDSPLLVCPREDPIPILKESSSENNIIGGGWAQKRDTSPSSISQNPWLPSLRSPVLSVLTPSGQMAGYRKFCPIPLSQYPSLTGSGPIQRGFLSKVKRQWTGVHG